MKHLFLIILFVVSFQLQANPGSINLSKISKAPQHAEAFRFIVENESYYDHWTQDWTYDKPKQLLIKTLRAHYTTFTSIPQKSVELSLLLGDISHYLYNLDDSIFFRPAVEHYESAIRSSPADFRGYWFLGNHYAHSNVPDSAIQNLLKAQTLLPKANEPAAYWNDLAWATAIANMPSTCIYAMDKVTALTGSKGKFETTLGETIYKRMEPMDKTKDYPKAELWTANQGEKITFTSRPLGIKIHTDTAWQLSIYDYSNGQCAFIINPATLKTKKGKEISYTVALLAKPAEDGEKLSDYIGHYVSKYPGRMLIPFSLKYEKMVAFEIKDKDMYSDKGGAHLYMIGIERDEPKYAGMLLETPSTLPDGKSGVVTYYSAPGSKERFKGRIFYAVLLDTCEDIHEGSLALLKRLFEEQLWIE